MLKPFLAKQNRKTIANITKHAIPFATVVELIKLALPRFPPAGCGSIYRWRYFFIIIARRPVSCFF
ncbi:hypothetical protein EKK58_01835 [Candidatus Dependentiae bacterium]|nr:MAG: hypothetical protein EKK58_01835 [Candidatus Dependentiae bacterium]